MTINVLWVILAFAIGFGTSQSIEGSAATTEANRSGSPVDQCYINGTWYNPCPTDPGSRLDISPNYQ